MDLVTQLNNLASRFGLTGFTPFAIAARVILDENNEVVFDGSTTALGAKNVITKKASFSAAQMQALGAVANGDISAFILPPGAVVLSTTVKPSVAPNGGKATGTLTSNNTNVSDGHTVTIGTKVYTFKTALTPTEGEVLIGADADGSLLNLIRAINHTGTPGTHYSCAAANTDVTAAASVTAHAFAVTAILNGAPGNAIATTETATGAVLAWGAATLTGGGAAVATATARLISAQNNYGTAFDVAQAPGAEVLDFFATPKNELMGGKSTINMHLVITGSTLDLVQVGQIDAWCTYFVRS